MAAVRMSSLDRLLRCYGSAVLPTDDFRSERARDAADWGTMVHHWVETGEIFTSNDSHRKSFEKKLSLQPVGVREQFWPEDLTHETALAYNPVTGLAHMKQNGTREEKEEWKLSFDNGFVTGTVDSWGFLFGTLWVDDLKTGRFVHMEDHEFQIKGYALSLARALQYDGDVLQTITHWPKYPLASAPDRFGTSSSREELALYDARLASLLAGVGLAREDRKHLKLVPGESQCRYCPSQYNCPALFNAN